MGKCMIEVNSKKELDEIRRTYPLSVTMIRSDNCSHCREIHPVVEKRCKDVEGYVPVIDCPVDKPFCIEELRGYNKDGIPLIVGTERTNLKKPVFMIEGADKEQVKKNFDILKQIVDEQKRRSATSSEPEPKVVQEPRGYSPTYQPTEVDRMVESVLSFNPRPRNTSPVTLCTPGYDCDYSDYEDKAVNFLLSKKERRNRFF